MRMIIMEKNDLGSAFDVKSVVFCHFVNSVFKMPS